MFKWCKESKEAGGTWDDERLAEAAAACECCCTHFSPGVVLFVQDVASDGLMC